MKILGVGGILNRIQYYYIYLIFAQLSLPYLKKLLLTIIKEFDEKVNIEYKKKPVEFWNLTLQNHLK